MNRSYKKVLDGVRQHSPLLSFAEQGMSPTQVKQAIVDLLSPYFTDQKILNELAVELLVPDAVNVSKIENDAWARAMFTNVLNEYRHAAASDRNACFETCANWEGKIQHGISEYWSGFYLEIDKGELPLEEFKYEVFRNIGMLIEACMQPLLKELLIQVRIRRGKLNPELGVEDLDLGLVVGELFDTSGYPELVAPPPHGIRLNQWRNMAQHHKTRVENGLIIGTYGRGSNEKEVKFKRDELLNALKRVFSIFSVIKTAASIFIVDNLSEYQSRVKDVDVRTDVKILHLAAAIATQGFELTDISIGEHSVTAVVKDVTDAVAKERMFHASQFVYPVWSHFPTDEVIVEYLDKAGDLILTTVGKGSDCEEVSRKTKPFDEMANRVTFTLSEKGKSLFSNPAT
jgi:hypothetical protein